MTSPSKYGVKYGAKNDGPRIVAAADKEEAEKFAASVDGKVIELDADGAEKKRTPAPQTPAAPPKAPAKTPAAK